MDASIKRGKIAIKKFCSWVHVTISRVAKFELVPRQRSNQVTVRPPKALISFSDRFVCNNFSLFYHFSTFSWLHSFFFHFLLIHIHFPLFYFFCFSFTSLLSSLDSFHSFSFFSVVCLFIDFPSLLRVFSFIFLLSCCVSSHSFSFSSFLSVFLFAFLFQGFSASDSLPSLPSLLTHFLLLLSLFILLHFLQSSHATFFFFHSLSLSLFSSHSISFLSWCVFSFTFLLSSFSFLSFISILYYLACSHSSFLVNLFPIHLRLLSAVSFSFSFLFYLIHSPSLLGSHQSPAVTFSCICNSSRCRCYCRPSFNEW